MAMSACEDKMYPKFMVVCGSCLKASCKSGILQCEAVGKASDKTISFKTAKILGIERDEVIA